uniref:Uncharacterized protein n=1 Tax=Rangifer tarandus platyrhynchus TaxID=3082113 RepID=A0ACB0EW62_RANTA|nr:unnamed protein product [Rangifer tarandus platyrhynchus]
MFTPQPGSELPRSLMPTSALRFLAALMRRQPHRQAGAGWAGPLCGGEDGQPPACLPRRLPLGAPTSPQAGSQLWSRSKGPGQRALLGRGRSKPRKREKPGEARPSGRKRLSWEELLFLRRGREETLEKQRRVDRRRTALTQEASLLEASNLEGANLQMPRNDSLLGRGRGPQPIDRDVRLRNTHKPGARKSWICPHPAPRHRPPSRPRAPTRRSPPRKTHTLGPWFTTLIEYPNYSVQIENTVFSYKRIVK